MKSAIPLLVIAVIILSTSLAGAVITVDPKEYHAQHQAEKNARAASARNLPAVKAPAEMERNMPVVKAPAAKAPVEEVKSLPVIKAPVEPVKSQPVVKAPVVAAESMPAVKAPEVKAVAEKDDFTGFSAGEFTALVPAAGLLEVIAKEGVPVPEGRDDIDKLNNLLRTNGLRSKFPTLPLPPQAADLIKREAGLTENELMQLNRLILETAYPQQCPMLHKVVADAPAQVSAQP